MVLEAPSEIRPRPGLLPICDATIDIDIGTTVKSVTAGDLDGDGRPNS